MRELATLCLCLLLTLQLAAQGGWTHVTDSSNAVSGYTTALGYVGVSFVDLNGDNAVDIYAAPRTLFLNDGSGRFSALPFLAVSPQQGAAGASWADLDNDGDNDAVVAAFTCKVFFNQGGTFVDSSAQVPNFSNYIAWGAAIGDMDENRNLDFVFAHAAGFHPGVPQPCRLYRQGLPVFSPESLTGYTFTDSLAPYTVPYWSDYDLDGDMDLFIASGPANGTPGYDPCYKNLKIETGMDTLVPMTTELFALQTQDGQCYNFIDHDNDGDLDLCLANYFSAPTRFYRNDAGTYTVINTPFSTSSPNLASCWGDYDNDGDLDVIITNGNVAARYFRNNGNGTFSYLVQGFTTPTAVATIANADVDNDGDLDLFANGIGNNGNGTSTGLYRNDTVAGNRGFINLSLVGTVSNRSAIGAIVRLKASINGNPTWQIREVNAQNTFQGQNDLRVHFGLGNAVTVDSIRIDWPSGIQEDYVNQPGNAFYIVTEGQGMATQVKETPLASHSWRLAPNPVEDVLEVIGPIGVEDGEMSYTIMGIDGKAVRQGKVQIGGSISGLRHLPAGTYLLRVASQNGGATMRFIKL